MNPSDLRAAGLVASVLWLATACTGGITTMPMLAVQRPAAAGDNAAVRQQFDLLVGVAVARGYAPAPLQPGRLRFGVRAHYTDRWVEEHGPYRIAVECDIAGTCHITPLGPRVERVSGQWELPGELREEAEALQQAMHAALAQ